MKKILLILIAFISIFASLQIHAANYKYDRQSTWENKDKFWDASEDSWEFYECEMNEIYLTELISDFFSAYPRLTFGDESQEDYAGLYLMGFMEEFKDLRNNPLEILTNKKKKTVEIGDFIFYLGGENFTTVIKVEHRKTDVTRLFTFPNGFFVGYEDKVLISFNAFGNATCFYALEQL